PRQWAIARMRQKDPLAGDGKFVKTQRFVGEDVGDSQRRASAVMCDTSLGDVGVIAFNGESEDGFVGELLLNGNNSGKMANIVGNDQISRLEGASVAPQGLTPQPPLHKWRGGARSRALVGLSHLSPWPPLHRMERGNGGEGQARHQPLTPAPPLRRRSGWWGARPAADPHDCIFS